MSVENTPKRARGVERAFHILEFLREETKPLRPNDIAKGIQAPKSSVYEIVKLLLELGVLENVGKDGHVFLGRRLHFLGQSYLKHFDLAHEAEEYLSYLATTTKETAQLCMLDGNQYTVALMKEGARPFRISADVGERVPIPWTASGRLLLAHMSDEEILNFIPKDDFILPSGYPLPVQQYLMEVRKAGEEGFFSFDSISDTFTHCFAAPIYDEDRICIATLCLIAPKADATANYQQYRQVLIECANQLSEKLMGT